MPSLAKDTRPYFVYLVTDDNHVRTVERTAPAPCDVPEFTDEHEQWMESAHKLGYELVSVYATDYATAAAIALDDTRPSRITHHSLYGLQGMPRSAPAYRAHSFQHDAPDRDHALMELHHVREALVLHLTVASGKAWATGRTIHVDVPVEGKAPLHFTYTPAD